MLLSIDRLLQMFAEGKNIVKIAEQADCEVSDVVSLIEEARNLLNKHDKNFAKKKIILKKKNTGQTLRNFEEKDDYIKEILTGSELSAIPVNARLIMYISGISSGEPGHAGMGIVIHDRENRQVGKVSDYIGQRSSLSAEYSTFIRALKLADYFQADELIIRTDSELISRYFLSKYKTTNPETLKFINETETYLKKFKKFKIELISKNLNDKAEFLARKAFEKYLSNKR